MTGGRLRARFAISAPLPAPFQRGSETRRWVALAVRSTFTVADIGFLVLGTGLVCIGLAFMANGLGVLDPMIESDLGHGLAVGLVIAMLGGFLIGLAVEGPIGYTAPSPDTKPWESLLASVPSMFLFVWLIGLLERIADRFLLPYSELFSYVSEHLNTVQRAGVTTALIVGVPVMWAMCQFLAPRFRFLIGASPGALYIAWMIGVVVLYQP